MLDVLGHEIELEDHIAICFSNGNSTGYLRLGRVANLNPFMVRWDKNNKVSPPMAFFSDRVIVFGSKHD